MTSAEVRAAIRRGDVRTPTAALAPDAVQANLIAVPLDWAADVRELCARNPVPCPLIAEVALDGTTSTAAGADVRADIGAYRIWRGGVLVERVTDARPYWSAGELAGFLIGCSFTFEAALARAGLAPRHVTLGCNVPMYRTTWPLAPAGRLGGTWIVSMRPYADADVERVRVATRPYGRAHGEPVHWGDPGALGIADLARPDEGDAVPLKSGEVPVFWGCGVTPQAAIVASRVPFAITHEPGHMFVTDLRHDELEVHR